jgi:four helix bundle suffix protein
MWQKLSVAREKGRSRPAEVVANIAICLIHQANYLLDRQIKRLEQDFLKEGGLRERMTRARLHVRDRQRNGGPPPGKEPGK